MHRGAHDEEPAEVEIRDGLKCLMKCQKYADAEIERLKTLYFHEAQSRAMERRPELDILSLPGGVPDFRLRIAGAAAAAHNGVGITWEERTESSLANHAVVFCRSSSLAPIALLGQYLLLDGDDSLPGDEDLVAVETEDGKRYLQRLWSDGQAVHIEATNPTQPIRPIKLCHGVSRVRRIVGVLFHSPANCRAGGDGEEWAPIDQLPSNFLRDIVGVRVDGTSLEPVARDGQIVLARRQRDIGVVRNGTLACVDIRDEGAVLKRCYCRGDEWILNPVNPVEVEDPMHVKSEDILSMFPIAGILFRTQNEREVEEA
jgi:SOS-response transcriptional repressor LexA